MRLATMILMTATTFAAVANSAIEIEFRNFTQADWDFPTTGEKAKPPEKNSGWVEFDFAVPTTGWYALHAAWGSFTHELALDGRKLYYGGSVLNPGDPIPKKGVPKKLANLPLTAGKHTLRIARLGRVGFPASWPEKLILTPNPDQPTSALLAVRSSIDVVRVGEPIRFDVTGGAIPTDSRYTILARNLMTDQVSEVGAVAFPAGTEFVTREVAVRLPAEGVYILSAKCGDATLTAAEFRPFQVAAIDTSAKPEVSDRVDKELIIDLDCVKQTLNGKAIAPDRFFEGNGKSRVQKTALGSYRETGDGLGPEVEKSNVVSDMFSGFTYHLDVPASMDPYMLEVDYPDDDWRYAMVLLTNYEGEWDAKKPRGFLPPSSGMLSGGPYGLSHAMQQHKMVFWTHNPKIALTVLSGRLGHRAAVSKIRIYKVKGDLPGLTGGDGKGRVISAWNEQRDDWKWMVNAKGTLPREMPQLQKDFIALKRFAMLNAYSGMNAFWSTDVSYQQIWHHSEILKGYLPHGTEHSRLATLLCEKYGLKYYSEIFLGGQGHFSGKVLGRLDKDITRLRTYNYQGLDRNVGGFAPGWNIAHPAIQQIMIDIYGELADKLGDSPAFAGMCARFDGWLWDGLYGFTSIYWGYGDYTIAKFEQETGIKVPGNAGDQTRFETRYNFLTAPDMKARWIDWRCDLVMDFLQCMSARIRLKNPNVVLYLAGNANCDFLHGNSDLAHQHKQRWKNMGVDIDRLQQINGIAITPTYSYGRGKSHNYLAEQRSIDTITDVDYVNLGKNAVRSFAFYNQYDEWGSGIRFEDLGIPRVHRIHVTGASSYAGRHGLARHAAVLAEQDTLVLRDGGYGWTWGNRDILGPWIKEYTALPRRPFTPLPEARDPVAVWHLPPVTAARHSWRAGATHGAFYAVNREALPMSLTLDLLGAKTVTRLGTGETIALQDGALTLDLAPYELRAFRAPAGARITGAETTLPDGYLDGIKDQLVHGRQVERKITTGDFAANVTDAQRQRYQTQLAKAWDAFGQGRYWRARTLLQSAPMMAVYDQLGRLPDGQVVTRFPDMLQYNPGDRYEPDFPVLTGEALQQAALDTSPVADSASYDADWQGATVIQARNGKLVFELPLTAAGPYRLTIGHVAPTKGVVMASLNGQSLPAPITTKTPNAPEQTAFPVVRLAGKNAVLTLSTEGAFGIYAIKLEPVLKVLPTNLWSTIGPFRSFWERGGANQSAVKDGFAKVYPPQQDLALGQTCKTRDGEERRWLQTDKVVGAHADVGVNFAFRAKSGSFDICFARTFVTSDRDQEALLYIGTDWWATAYVNGEEVVSEDPIPKEEFNCAFNRWKPKATVIKLKKGVNTILVKNHGGSANNWFTARISDLPDLTIAPTPEDGK